MDFAYSPTQQEIAAAVRGLCARFPAEYWRRCDAELAYPDAFVQAMTEAGWLAALIPEAYGGSGLSLLDACVILQEINGQGGNAATCHAQMYTMAAVLQHGSAQQKQAILPRIASGALRLQAFGVTEPTAGSNTLRIKTFAQKVNGGYVINGAENLDLALSPVRHVFAAGAHHAVRGGGEEDRRPEPVPGGHPGRRQGAAAAHDRHHAEPPHQRGVHREPGGRR